ncbi:MAG: nuclear transport factor 2 family protein [Methanomicrobiales archaeon]|nr:nuclear transport factor 2 family protein [Methanomicrobiales archaeon]
MNKETVTGEILQTVNAVNRCYSEGWDEEEFKKHIHPDIVAIFPDSPGRIEGRDAYVSEWRGFCTEAVIRQRQETGHRVQVFSGGKAAVVTYLFSVFLSMGGQDMAMQGRDMFFLVKEGRKWLVAGQQFSEEPGGAVNVAAPLAQNSPEPE